MGLRDRYRQLPPHPLRPERRDVFIGVAGALISGMGAVADATKRVRMPGESDRTTALTVADRRVVAHDQDVIALTLVGEGLRRWHPGAHIDIHLPSGLVRQYSLCGDPATPDTYRIAVRRIPHGGGSIEMHDLRVGATVTTNGPRNAFPLTVPGYGSPARRFRFIAGGIGITPILPMLGLAQRFGVDWSMVYAGRSRDSLPFVDEVARFAAGRAGDSANVAEATGLRAQPQPPLERWSLSGPTTSVVFPRQRSCSATVPMAPLSTRAGPRRCRRRSALRSSAGTTSNCTSNGSPRRPSLTAGSSRCR
jgi:ferredoxin-NADP reductase